MKKIASASSCVQCYVFSHPIFILYKMLLSSCHPKQRQCAFFHFTFYYTFFFPGRKVFVMALCNANWFILHESHF